MYMLTVTSKNTTAPPTLSMLFFYPDCTLKQDANFDQTLIKRRGKFVSPVKSRKFWISIATLSKLIGARPMSLVGLINTAVSITIIAITSLGEYDRKSFQKCNKYIVV